KGKLTAFGGTVSLRGTIDGDVMVTAGTINIDSQMGGDVRLEADKIDVRPESHIVGDLNYVARSAPPEDLADRVGGELKFDEKGAKRDRAQTEKPAFAPLNWLGRWIWKTLVLFIIGCLVMVPLRRVDAGAALIRPLQTQAMLGGLIGFFGVIVLPIIAFLLVVLLIAVPMAVIFGFPEAFIGVLFSFPPLLAVVAVLLFVAQVPAVYWVGTHIQPTMIVWRTDERPSVHRARSVYLSMFLGAALVRLLATIPYIGWLVSLGVVWLGLGTTILAIHAALQRTTPSTNATV
ncbi:MAG: hypothetical protein OEV00_08270, partial [Acidobacteriota bacterium]|nr:hypothetical protein [Acidobacteriota bacterium]